MVTVNDNTSFIHCASGIRLPDCSKLAINQKNDNNVIIFRHDVILKFFWWFFFSLVKFSYWSKSQVSAIFFYKGLTRNPEIRNTPAWVLPNIWRLNNDTALRFSWIGSCLLSSFIRFLAEKGNFLRDLETLAYCLSFLHKPRWFLCLLTQL